MENGRKVKSVMLGSMDGRGKRGRPKREWLDDIREWCQKDVQTISRLAMEERCGKKWLIVHWTPTGNVPNEYDDDDDEYYYFSLLFKKFHHDLGSSQK